MSKSQRLALHDIRQVHELIRQVQCFGARPEIWQRVAIGGLLKILGGNVAFTVDIRLRRGVPQLLAPIDTGWQTEAVRQRFAQYATSGEMASDPGTMNLLAAQKKHRFLTCTRRQLVDDVAWYRSGCVSEARRMGDVNDFVVCSSELIANGSQGFIVYRCWHDPPFEARHRRIMQLFRLELLRAIRDGQRPQRVPDGLPGLTPRMRQTLELMLAGLSLKAVANQLHLSRHTTNDYQKAIYRLFDVTSHPELMCIFRPPKPPIRLPATLMNAE